MNHLDLLVPIAFFAMIAYITKTISDNNLRRKLVQQGPIDEKVKYLFRHPAADNPIRSLQWGLIIFITGILFLVKHILPAMSEMLLVGLILIASGSVLMGVYYLTEKKIHSSETLKESA